MYLTSTSSPLEIVSVVSLNRSVATQQNIEAAHLTQILGENIQKWQSVLQQPDTSESQAKAVNKKRFSCKHCKRKFVYLTGLSRHVQKFHPDKECTAPDTENQTEEGEAAPANSHPRTLAIVVKCKNCGEIFPEPKRFEAHTSRFNWELMFVNHTEELGEKGAALFSQQLFIVIIHTVFQCEFCDALFSDCLSLFYHEAHHTPHVGYACTFCRLNFLTLETVLDHRAHCTEYKNFRAAHLWNVSVMYSCNACAATFSSLAELYEHRYANHHYFPRRNGRLDAELRPGEGRSGLWLHCEICGFCCDHVYKLLQHRAEKHAESGRDTMAVAEKPAPSTQKTVKRVDKEVDTNLTRQFLCEKCGKTYTQSSHLWQHLRFHNGVRPFACSVQGCTRRFTIRPDLSDHIRKCHTGERPYVCEVCHKRFLTGSVFYQHRLIHRNERRHACKDCDRRFYRADALKNHMRIHTGEKPYACTHCDRKFRQRGDREKHVRVKHMKYR
ncbi:testis-specific zinc finger protein topi-like [Anopheles stephensi]|uniref:testis-specific zinc finger protein topi-like n=1 Tax=Anopheles stephensi TaxID=30069 RepID=UPI00165892C8|nr:testis-specific zinc finger protein topi-like [Anopheles stephensi]